MQIYIGEFISTYRIVLSNIVESKADSQNIKLIDW